MTFLTIAIAVGIYLFRNNGETFKSFSKEKILEFGYQKLEDNLSIVKDEKFRDSIKILLQKQVHSLKKENFDEAMNEFGYTGDKIKDIIRDKKIDSLEFYELKKLVIDNERSKKNRN
ncbi:MAG: hypothetical protein HZA74_13845 [Ignavibacteriales bacterium]|nr:hypothetical protein [Ignavibacteriales bacterium]